MALNRVFYESVGKRIQHRRTESGMTQEKLGSLLEPTVTRAAIANMEAGKQGILLLTLVQIAKQLGVETSDLLPSERHEPLQESKQTEADLIKEGIPRATTKRLSRTIHGTNKRVQNSDVPSQLVSDLLEEGLPQGASRRLAGRLLRTQTVGRTRKTK